MAENKSENKNTKEILKEILSGALFGLLVLSILVYFSKTGKKLFLEEKGKISSSESTTTIKEIIPGAGTLSEKGEVLTPSGKVAENSAIPGSENAPVQSRALLPEEIPKDAIKIEVSAKEGFSPSSFRVLAGKAVTLVLVSTDGNTHNLSFDDPVLNAVVIGVSPGSLIRGVAFNAPLRKGEYAFHNDVPGRSGVGKMIVE